MKTPWCVRLQHIALAGVLLVGLAAPGYAADETAQGAIAVTAIRGENGQVLEFLNLFQTTGLTPVQATANFARYGFHWATAREVNLLLSAFNLTPVASGPFQVIPNDLSDIESFLKFVGETPSFPTDFQTPSARGFYNDELKDNLQRFVQVTTGPTSFPTEPPSVANNRFEGCDDSCAADAVGVFLVRAITILISQDQCKKGGWKAFGFKNQDECIKFVNSLLDNDFHNY